MGRDAPLKEWVQDQHCSTDFPNHQAAGRLPTLHVTTSQRLSYRYPVFTLSGGFWDGKRF